MKDTLFLIKVVLVECLFGTFDVRPVESVGGVASDWSIIPYLHTFTPPEVTPLCSQMWCLRHTTSLHAV